VQQRKSIKIAFNGCLFGAATGQTKMLYNGEFSTRWAQLSLTSWSANFAFYSPGLYKAGTSV